MSKETVLNPPSDFCQCGDRRGSHPTAKCHRFAFDCSEGSEKAKRVGEVEEAKAKVLAKWPRAYSRKHVLEEVTRIVVCWTIYTPQPGYEKDCVMVLNGGWDSTEDAAWLDADAKLSTPPEAEEKVTWHVKSDDGFYEKSFVDESSALAMWEMPYWKNRDSMVTRDVTTTTVIATRKRTA